MNYIYQRNNNSTAVTRTRFTMSAFSDVCDNFRKSP